MRNAAPLHARPPSRLRTLFRRHHASTTIQGIARIDLRTKNLLHRINPGEIAVIVHDDLDQAAAEGLVDRGVIAVINCRQSITGRYPNAGPLVLARAHIPLLDAAGDSLLERIAEGDLLRIAGDAIYRGEEQVGTGVALEGDALERALEAAHSAMGEELERFARNTMAYLQSERDLVLHGAGMPALRIKLSGRPAVVAVRGNEFRKDLQTLRGYIAEMKPVMIAVDGAADAMIEEGMTPDVIIGDMDSVSTGALTCGAEIVVHAYPDGRAPGLDRVGALGLEAHLLRSAGTSEDIALLLAYERGADLIVAVGAHDNMIEFLDKGRGGMASTFVVRLKVGPKLVDAKGVNRLYRSQVRTRDMVLLIGSAVFAMVVATTMASPGLRLAFRYLIDVLKDVFH